MTQSPKPLYLMRNGEKFIYNGNIYTVFTREGNMAEVFSKGRFWAWPTWNGTKPLIVNSIIQEHGKAA